MIGLIAGSGNLPLLIARTHPVKIALIEGNALAEDYLNFEYKIFKLGEVGEVIKYFKEYNIENICFAGGVKRPNLKNIKVDKEGALLLASILPGIIRGDDYILKKTAKFFENKGFKILAPNILIKDTMSKKGLMSGSELLEQDIKDIEYGKIVLSHFLKLDIGQSVIIEEGTVIGMEAIEGTGELIKRCSLLKRDFKRNGILIKGSKIDQDLRLDCPSIGEDTIKQIEKFGFKGVALEAEKVIIIEYEKTIKLASELGIFIYGY